MPTRLAIAALAVLALLALVYFAYLGCALGQWRAMLIEGARCAR